MENLNINEIYIVTNNKFYSHFLNWSNNYQSKIPIKIINDKTESNEDRLGAIGDINFVVNNENINDDLLIIGGDNLFEDDLTKLTNQFKEKGSSILLNDVKNKELAKLYGIVTLDNENKIINFAEKPDNPSSTLASTLIYALKKEHLSVLQEVLDKGLADRSGDFIKYLSEKNNVYGFPLKGKWFDIGSLQQLEEADSYYKNKIRINSLTIRIGGEAGRGIASAADILSDVFIHLGYNIFSTKDYASQIRGGHNYHNVRISKSKIDADVDVVNVLLALDKTTFETHNRKVSPDGIIICNENDELESENYNKPLIEVPLAKIENELNQKNIDNAVFLGATIKSLNVNFTVLENSIKNYFKKKVELSKILVEAARKGYGSINEVKYNFINEENKENINLNVSFLSGNDAITKGALNAGLEFHAQYPMTPVSAILHNLAKEAVENKSLTVIQPEDEIAAINMALGASYAGKRAMTATSGGGFCLMIESLGLAGMAEIPLVIIEGQRPGPATGLPTKTEQGDLSFVLSAGQGDFPQVIIAPGDIEECHTETKRAFYLAEKYQLPVILLIDKHLAESFKTIDLEDERRKFDFNFSKKINIIDEVNPSDLNEDGLFKRYQKDNLKRAIPGTRNGIYTSAGDEHNEVGYIIEDPLIRKEMMKRRMNKLLQIENELPPLNLIGPEDAELTIVSWGSNKGAILEAVNKLNLEGKKVNFLQIKHMLPFQTNKVKDYLTNAKKLVLVENNYSAQLGNLITEKLGLQINNKILRYDGKTFTVDDIYNKLKEK